MHVGSYAIFKNIWIDEEPKFFRSDPILVERCSKTKVSQEGKYRVRAKNNCKISIGTCSLAHQKWSLIMLRING
jgi:hypothetical protein